MPCQPLTVLLTVYNGMPWLPLAVESILGQTRSDFRFLILDNASNDGSGAYLDGLDDTRVQVQRQDATLPRTAILNLGLSQAEDGLLAIIDADDLAAPARLEKQADFLKDHPDVALVGCDVTYIDPHGRALGADRFPTDHASLCARMPLHNQFAHAGCMYRVQAARSVGGYPAEFPYAQDQALWLRMILAGFKVASIAEYLASIRVHTGRMSSSEGLARDRAEDDQRLSAMIAAIDGLPPSSRQAARFRRAAALYKLGRKAEARAELVRGFREYPLGLPFNPLLWKRLYLQARRRF